MLQENKYNIPEGCRMSLKNRRPYDPIPEDRLYQVYSRIKELEISLSSSDVKHILGLGRSKLINNLFKISIHMDEYGLVTMDIHKKKMRNRLE